MGRLCSEADEMGGVAVVVELITSAGGDGGDGVKVNDRPRLHRSKEWASFGWGRVEIGSAWRTRSRKRVGPTVGFLDIRSIGSVTKLQ